MNLPDPAWQSELARALLLVPMGIFYWGATGRGRLSDTTLVAPIRWGFVAFLMLVYLSVSHFGDNPYLTYAAAVLMIAPTLALLGAKRPQNGAWQFIVMTLVGVLLLPVAQGLAFGDPQPHVHTLFRWLIAAHIVVGVVNYLPTMFAGPACCFGAAQACAARDLLPFPGGDSNLSDVALLLFCASLIGVRVLLYRRGMNGPGLHRLWFDFRDAHGLVWGLRIAERLNVVASKHAWPVEFTWGGMLVKTESGELDAEVRHRVERELRSHLRRFVSHEWIARRLSSTSLVASEPRT
jgi:hypothetical protein